MRVRLSRDPGSLAYLALSRILLSAGIFGAVYPAIRAGADAHARAASGAIAWGDFVGLAMAASTLAACWTGLLIAGWCWVDAQVGLFRAEA